MSKRILRPLDTGGLLDELFDIYRSKFLLLFGISALVFVPFYTLFYSAMQNFTSEVLVSTIGQPSMPSMGSIAYLVLVGLLFVPLSIMSFAATTWAVSETYLDNEITIADSYKAASKKLLRLIGASFLKGILVIVGTILCLVPGFLVGICLVFVPAVVMLEGKSVTDSLVRSKDLAVMDFGRVLVVAILLGLVLWAISTAMSLPARAIAPLAPGNNPAYSPVLFVISGVVQGIIASLLNPLWATMFVILYYDLRVRKEGFDLELLATSMGEPVTTPESKDQPV